MAVTKIHAIKSTVAKAIKYILDPAKTDGTLLASGFHCEPALAHLDFEMTSLLAKEIRGDHTKTGGSDNLAYHLIQSFSKTDKLTPEQAHELGKGLADEVYLGKHEYVVATHIDKGHIHNHIIANSVSFLDFNKFRTRPYETARKIREVSDRICRENGLHVIENPKGKGQDKRKWQTQPSWRDRLQLAIDKAIYTATNYQEFTDLLKTEKVEIKEGQHIAFKMPGQQRFIRGKSIGPQYEREQIKARIADPSKSKVVEFLPHTKIEKAIYRMSSRQIIQEIQRTANALVLTRREKVFSYQDYDIRLNELKEQCKAVRNTLKDLDDKSAQYRNVSKLLVAYNKHLPLVQQYEQLPKWKKKKFLSSHDSELSVFAHAEKMLLSAGAEPVDMNSALEFLKEHSEKTGELGVQFRQIEERIKNLDAAKKVIGKILGHEQEEKRDGIKRRTIQELTR
jgi:hypothetical protein